MSVKIGEKKLHVYTSTACQHGLHDKCRLVCKYCDEPCRCGCHKPGAVQRAGVPRT